MKIESIAGFPIVNVTLTKTDRWGKNEAVDSNLVKSLNARYYVRIYISDSFKGEDILLTSALPEAEDISSIQEMATLICSHFTKHRLPVHYRNTAVVKLFDVRTSTRIDINAFIKHGYEVKSYAEYPLNVYSKTLPKADEDGLIDVSTFSGPDAFSVISMLLGHTPTTSDEAMKRDKWSVRYISSTDEDVCSVWVYADTKSEAINEVRSEYHDIKEIITASKI